MSGYLFAYGTLQRGLAPEYLLPVVSQLVAVGEGSVAGLLYDLGEYPGMVLDGESGMKVFGTVFVLPDEDWILAALDGYEGFYPDSVESSLFVRELHPVELMDGRRLDCWVYVYNLETDDLQVLASGRFVG
jgi:gamma-glutamylcyclotransferase (GGCT)/AIG2-like uncharacterized protein YtfP